MRVKYLTGILSTVITAVAAGVPFQASDNSNVIVTPGGYPTTCGCQTCPCGASTAVPVCVNGVCHTATPKLKRRLFSRKNEIRFYTEPSDGIRQRWKKYRDRRYRENTVSPAVLVGQSPNMPGQVVTVAQPYMNRCDNCAGEACGKCRRSIFHRSPATYRIETKIKKNHWWNRKPVAPLCNGSVCTGPVTQVLSYDGPLVGSPLINTPNPHSFYSKSSNSASTIAIPEPMAIPTLAPSVVVTDSTGNSPLVDYAVKPVSGTNTTISEAVPTTATAISDTIPDSKSLNSTLT